MISGKSFRSLLALGLFSLAPGPAPAEATVSLADILHPSRQQQVMRFHEDKNLRILDQTLTSSGILRFVPPDTLIREMDGSPGKTYRIEGNQLSISKAGEVVRQLDLQTSPELTGFAVTLRALLSADIERLNQQFTLTLTGTKTNWVLQLTPRDDMLSRLIERISIQGGDNQIRFIDTYETGGNHSHMTLLPNE